MDIFENQTDSLIEALNISASSSFDLVELGAGDGSKTFKLLNRLIDLNIDFSYNPVDISSNSLKGLELMLSKKLPTLKVIKQEGDYFEILSKLKNSGRQKIVLFLGSNIGNMTDTIARDFICKLGEQLNSNDRLLLGVDLIKPAEIVLAAYDDSQGVTAAFNLNLLHRINKEFIGNFDINNFVHSPIYSEEEAIAKSYIKSTTQQSVYLKKLNVTINFTKGELIHTEISRKYNDKIIRHLLNKTNFTIDKKLTDSKGYFSDYILVRE